MRSTYGSPPRAWGRAATRSTGRRSRRFTPTRVGTSRKCVSPHRCPPVHPHARGDEGSGGGLSVQSYGSPPRAWGRVIEVVDVRREPRFTPTRVGTSPPRPQPVALFPVHPHARGDEQLTLESAPRVLGSPPRAWGREDLPGVHRPRRRFTPTRVGTRPPHSPSSPQPPVHPHARGDEFFRWSKLIRTHGSPPRAWGRGVACGSPHLEIRFTPTRVGTRRYFCQEEDARRFTPTRVGTRAAPSGRWTPSTVHPHARGDEKSIAPSSIALSGSPPRAWGRVVDRVRVVVRVRFTPTRVGTSRSPGIRRPRPPVHPHARGDERGVMGYPTDADGSPPRAWGRDLLRATTPGRFRFTPTRVGTSPRAARAAGRHPVHPHARGDELRAAFRNNSMDGSPPRAWGRVPRATNHRKLVRFTPTRVGTRPSTPSTPSTSTVHPHARGDESAPRSSGCAAAGSPPRAWGRDRWARRGCDGSRFTPTRVGTSRTRPACPPGRPVHPHARGDEAVAELAGAEHYGSPPRAWGRGTREGRPTRLRRFTPTRVGTSPSRRLRA